MIAALAGGSRTAGLRLALALGLLMGFVQGAEITADRMSILNLPEGKVTVFENGVTIVDGATRIAAGKVEFYDQENLAVIHGGAISITTATANVTADSARYLIGAKQTYLYGHVVVRREGLEISSSSLLMDNAADAVSTESPLHIIDSRRGMDLTGGAGSFNLGTEDGVIHGAPRMQMTQGSPLTITGDEMQLSRSSNLALTTGNVTVNTKDAVLTCDTLHYFLEQDSARATGRPKLVQNDNTVTGDRMAFRFEEGDMKRIDVFGDGQATPTLRQKEDEIAGRRILVQFEQGKLAEIEIFGDSGVRHEMRQKLNRGRGDRIAFRFADGVIAGVKLLGHSTGTYYTDDGDRIEVLGDDSFIRFRDGNAVMMEVSNVREGRLYRAGKAKN